MPISVKAITHMAITTENESMYVMITSTVQFADIAGLLQLSSPAFFAQFKGQLRKQLGRPGDKTILATFPGYHGV